MIPANAREKSGIIEKHPRASLAGLILIGVLVMLVAGSMKSSVAFHVDEMWQYSFANSNGGTTKVVELTDFSKWLPSTIFRDYITVQPGERFAFSSITQSAKKDIHPPLSHYALNAVCSFFPNVFTKWFGLGLNIGCYIITLFLLYLLAREVFGSHKPALLASTLWGFSLGAVDTVMYIRMYCMLTMFSVAAAYCAVKFLTSSRLRYLLLGFVVFVLGGLTDYIFWILGFFLTLAFVLVNFRRNLKASIQFAAMAFFSVVAACLIFPTTILQLIEKDSFSHTASDMFDVVEKLNLFFDWDYVVNRFAQECSYPIFFLPAGMFLICLNIVTFFALAAVVALIVISIINTGKPGTAPPESPKEFHALSANQSFLSSLRKNLPAMPAILRQNTAFVFTLISAFISRHKAGVLVFLAVFSTAYVLAAIFPNFHSWTVRAFFYLFPFMSIGLASVLLLLHHKLNISARVLTIIVAVMLVSSYLVVGSPFLFRTGYEKLGRKIKGMDVIFVVDSDSSIMRLPNFCPALAQASRVYMLAIRTDSYRAELLNALKASTTPKTMIINTIGSPPQNDMLRHYLGPQLELTNDQPMVDLLKSSGYHIGVEKRANQVFQYFNLYEVTRTDTKS